MTAWTHPRVEHWDDEREIGNSLIVTLRRGWRFSSDPFIPVHVEGYDTVKAAQAGVRSALPCKCERCLEA